MVCNSIWTENKLELNESERTYFINIDQTENILAYFLKC